MIDGLQPTWIDIPATVAKVAEACAEAGRCSLDTEADSLFAYFHKVCLIQVSAADRHFVIDPLALPAGALEPLWKVVAEPGLPVIMHGADYDIRVLDRDFGVQVSDLWDTQIMAQLLGEPRTGLAALLDLELGLTLDKRFQRANWGRRPLSADMLAYAAADTCFLSELADRLRARLVKLNRWSWAEEEFAQLRQVRYTAVECDPVAFEKIKGARRLKGRARDRVFTLFGWRDGAARASNLPPFKILGNHQMVVLAQDPPRGPGDLARINGLGPRFVRQWGNDVLDCLRQPRTAPAKTSQQRARRPEPPVRELIKRLMTTRDAVAEELGLGPGIVCPRALAEAVADGGPATTRDELVARGLDGWRLAVLGEGFLAICAEMA